MFLFPWNVYLSFLQLVLRIGGLKAQSEITNRTCCYKSFRFVFYPH